MRRSILLIPGALIVLAAIVLWSHGGYAQQEDPRIAAYRQLLTRANDEITLAMAQANALAVENAKLKADLAKTKGGEKKD